MTPTSSYILKIYDGFFGSIKHQLDDFVSIDIEQDIVDISTATLRMSPIDGIEMLDRFEIYEVGGTDTLLFGGFVKELSISEDLLDLRISGWKSLLNRKLLISDVSGSNLAGVIQSVLTSWNGATGENITLDCPTTTGDYKGAKGISLFSFLEEILGEDFAFDFDIITQRLTIRQTLGELKEYLYTYSPYHLDSNIVDVGVSIYDNISTVDRNFATNTQSTIGDTSKYGVLMKSSEDKELVGVERSFGLTIFSSDLHAGDAFTLEVLGSSYMHYYGSAWVLRESITIDRGGKVSKLEVGTKLSKKQSLTQILLGQVRK